MCLLLCQAVSSAQTSVWVVHDPYYGEQGLYLDDSYFPSDSLSSVNLKVVYRYTSVIDTVERTVAEELMQLEVGPNLSKYSSYERFRLDSLLKNRPETSVIMGAIKIFSNKKIVPTDYFEAIYQNYPAGRETVIGRIVAMDFMYEEPMPVFEWQITDETDTWCGYVIQKATCSFRGRAYEAWFTFDIPVSSGPWKFNGLPGLILKVSDAERHYCFEAVRVSNQETGTIGMPRYLFQKTDRKEYLKAKSQIIANYQLYQRYYSNRSGIIVSPQSGYKKKELRNDLMERE